MVGKFALSLAALASAAAAVNPVSVKGAKFVDSKGSRFEMVGVAYQPGGSAGFNPATGVDPLSDAKTCLRDAAIMQKMGINTIRVYNLDPNVSHDDCAGIFDAAGIYMVIDVNSPLQGQSLDAAQPWTTYTKDYMTRVFQVIEAFKGYPNLVGFFAGNEVINDVNSGKIDPPYIRAVTRDMKNYIAKQSPGRAIAVGYSAADVRSILVDTSNYLQCSMDGDDKDMSKIDFFGLNSYSWCGQSTMAESGYDQLVTDFTGSTIPVFFSEYGCNAVTPRPWTEVAAIYGPSMNKVFSGALAYEYTQETNNYGLVKVASDGSAQLMQDFDNLETQLSKINFKALADNSTAAAPSAPKCSAGLIKTSGFNTNFTLPAVPEGVQDLINNGVKTGYKGGAAVTKPTDTKCPFAVTDSQNKPITGLAIKAGVSGPTSVGGSGSSSSSNSTSAASNSTSSGAANSGGDKGASFVQPTNGTAADHADDDGCHSTVTSTITHYASATSSSAASSTPPSAASNTPPSPAKSSPPTGASSTPIKTGGAATLKAISPISILALVVGAFVL